MCHLLGIKRRVLSAIDARNGSLRLLLVYDIVDTTHINHVLVVNYNLTLSCNAAIIAQRILDGGDARLNSGYHALAIYRSNAIVCRSPHYLLMLVIIRQHSYNLLCIAFALTQVDGLGRKVNDYRFYRHLASSRHF